MGKTRTSWKKGQSGNPGGRPKDYIEVVRLARQLSPKSLRTIESIMDNEKASPLARLRAAELILDRAFGKPKQALEVDIDATTTVVEERSDLASLSTEQLRALHAIRKTLDEARGPQPESH